MYLCIGQFALFFIIKNFTFLLHDVQDGDGPVRAPQEPRDALHHPFHLVLFRGQSAPAGRGGSLGQIPGS